MLIIGNTGYRVCGNSVLSLQVLHKSKTIFFKKFIYKNQYIFPREGNGTPLQYSCWQIPWTEGPGGLQSMGSLGVGYDRATSLYFFTSMHWRRKWQPTPVFLPGESQGQGSLVGCRLWGCTESDMTEVTQQQQQQYIFPKTLNT